MKEQIIKKFGSFDEFKKIYIQALIDNQAMWELEPTLREIIHTYRDKLIVRF